MKLSLAQAFPVGIIGVTGFGLGQFSSALEAPSMAPACIQTQYQETAIVQLQALEGDELLLSINGPVRLVWNDDYVEGDGDHRVVLGQLPSEHDADFRAYRYVGNAGTYKFYPSNTYAARGTDPVKRRFFISREAAEAAGFVASKLVKN